MNNLRKVVFSLLYITFCSAYLFGQVPQAHALKPLLIEALEARLAPVGQMVETPDSNLVLSLKHKHVGALLNQTGNANVRLYGADLTASVGMRGGAANQTILVWNGFKLQKPLSGLVDFSLIPSALFEEIKWIPGAHGPLWGSSAVGGMVSIQNVKPTASGYTLHQSFGALGRKQTDIKLAWKRHKFTSVTRGQLNSAHNHFNYTLPDNTEMRRQTFGYARFGNIMQEIDYQAFKSFHLRYFFWANHSSREIPPLITQTLSRAKQWDSGMRQGVHASWSGERINIQARVARFWEDITYHDSLQFQFSQVAFTTWQAETEMRLAINAHQTVQVGAQYTTTRGVAPGYLGGVQQERSAYFLSWVQTYKRVRLQTDLRQVRGNQKWLIGVPGLGAQITLNQYITCRTRLGLTFREPTLNDLYWRPGGNLNLKSERGESGECGLDFAQGHASGRLVQMHVTAYARTTRNLIYWAPIAGSPIWSASNLAEVGTRGLDVQGSLQKKWRNTTTLRFMSSAEWVRAQHKKAVVFPSIARGEQLWFVPKVQSSSSATLLYKQLACTYQFQVSSKVRTPEGNLKGNRNHQVTAQYQLRRKNHKITSYIRFDNLFNQTWYSVDRRPLPGRTWAIGLRLHH